MPDLFAIIDAGFERAEGQTGRSAALWRHPMPDGREVVVDGARLCVRTAGQEAASRDEYVYATPMSAVLGAARWFEGDCRREPDGWTRHTASGRARPTAAARSGERAWVCPRHPDRLAAFHRGHLWCPACGAQVADAVRVPWPPHAVP